MKELIGSIKSNSTTIIFVAVWFSLIPYFILVAMKYILGFGFLQMFISIVLVEIMMICIFPLFKNLGVVVKANLMMNDKEVYDGKLDFRAFSNNNKGGK